MIGRGPSTRYKLSPQAHVTMELNLDTYFDKDVDERQVQESFNFELINDILPKVDLFTLEEKIPGYPEVGRNVRLWAALFAALTTLIFYERGPE